MAKQTKYYVVWKGRKPGIYTSWMECERQVKGFAAARFKSFPTEAEARQAFAQEPPPLPTRRKQPAVRPKSDMPPNPPDYRHDTVLPLPPEVKAKALAVDAACSGNPGKMEYRGVNLETGEEVFHYGPIKGTNNIGEFLAIVHALALLKQQQRDDMVIYSDSRNAQLWVKGKKCKTKLARNDSTETVHQLIERAERWLHDNSYTTHILKWDTQAWGEIPADFGRK